LVYVYDGEIDLIKSHQLGIGQSGSTLKLTGGPAGVNLSVLSKQPISEPVKQYGPLVMNSVEKINRALKDVRNPKFWSQLKAGRNEG